MGPMSLATDGKGRVYVLDEVNDRVVRYGADGKPEGESPMTLKTAQDIAVADDGSMAVLDRFGEKSVALYDEGGAPRGLLPLAGDGIDDPGDVTGVIVDGDQVYAEREHGPAVLLGDTKGNPADERSEIPGRPSRDGKSFLKAGITDAEMGRVYVTSSDRATGDHRFTREIREPGIVEQIVLLDSDKKGTIYFAATIDQGGQAPVVLLSCLEPLHGAIVGGATLPANTMPEETFRDLVVLDGGGVLYALRTEAGVSYVRYDCQ